MSMHESSESIPMFDTSTGVFQVSPDVLYLQQLRHILAAARTLLYASEKNDLDGIGLASLAIANSIRLFVARNRHHVPFVDSRRYLSDVTPQSVRIDQDQVSVVSLLIFAFTENPQPGCYLTETVISLVPPGHAEIRFFSDAISQYSTTTHRTPYGESYSYHYEGDIPAAMAGVEYTVISLHDRIEDLNSST